MTKIAYGIDFGTTNSTIAIVDGNGVLQKIPIDPDAENPGVMRSLIYINSDLKFLYGQPAINAYSGDVSGGKGRIKKTLYTGRFITVAGNADIHGVRPDEVVEELIEFDEFQGGRMLQSLKTVLSNNHLKGINLFGKIFSIEEIVGGYLKEVKIRADSIVGENVDSVVIGKPVRYVGNDDKLAVKRMKKAAELAGFKSIKFEYEPIAAAYDYGNKIKESQTVLIFDFGGGTLDVSIVKFPENTVMANKGIPVGGDLFNSEIFTAKLAGFFGSKNIYGPNKVFMPGYIYLALRNWFSATLLKDEDFDKQMEHFRFMSSEPEAIDALRSLVNNNLSFSMYDEIDRVKRSLSIKQTETFKFIEDHINVKTQIDKNDFENMIQIYIEQIDELLDETVKDAEINISGIDAVATTGGTSLTPVVRKLLAEKFGKEKIIESDAFTSVAAGLALHAKKIFG